MSGLGTNNSDIIAMVQRAQNKALRIINFNQERHQVHFYTLRQRLNLITTLNNCMFVFDHLNSSLPTYLMICLNHLTTNIVTIPGEQVDMF